MLTAKVRQNLSMHSRAITTALGATAVNHTKLLYKESQGLVCRLKMVSITAANFGTSLPQAELEMHVSGFDLPAVEISS